MDVVDVVLTGLLILVCGLGMLLTVFQLPGTWLIAASAVGFAWYSGWSVIGPWTAAVIVGLAAAAEAGEMVTGTWFTKRAGGSRRAAWWGLAGGLGGALVLSVPVPIVGTVIGAAVGCFCAALAAELSLNKSAADAANVGLQAAVGRTVGTIIKVTASVILAGLTIVSAVLGQ